MKRAELITQDPLRFRARELALWGILENWDEYRNEPWLKKLIDRHELEVKRRSLERRIQHSRLSRFKPIADFDWSWPKEVDRELIEELFTLRFIDEGANIVIVGPNGIGKTMISKGVAYAAILSGHTALFTTASELLNDLASHEGAVERQRCLRKYLRPTCLVIDELGYLSYDNRYADLLFEVVTNRYKDEKPLIITTNKPFGEWGDVFSSATCVVTLVDRLVHRAEIVNLQGPSYRLKEAKERTTAKAKQRKSKKRKTKSK